MVVRVLLVLAAFAVLHGCGQASSPVEKQERREGAEQAAREEGEERSEPPSSPEATTAQAEGNIPISGVVGENVETGSYDLRVLDHFFTDRYYYVTDLTLEEVQDAIPTAGRFLVVNYSVTNTSPQTVGPNLIGALHVTAPDGTTEVYDQTELITPPHRSAPNMYLEDIPPRQMLVSQFIFDVPTDVEPELLVVTEEPTINNFFDVGAVDLRDEVPQRPRPEEIFALQYEYGNMYSWSRAYELFAEESKERVPFERYKPKMNEDPKNIITSYSFPSVLVQGDQATIERVFSWETPDEEGQDKATQQAVLEDEGWRIVMRDDQYEFFLGE